jgi:hypothetical protein
MFLETGQVESIGFGRIEEKGSLKFCQGPANYDAIWGYERGREIDIYPLPRPLVVHPSASSIFSCFEHLTISLKQL